MCSEEYMRKVFSQSNFNKSSIFENFDFLMIIFPATFRFSLIKILKQSNEIWISKGLDNRREKIQAHF